MSGVLRGVATVGLAALALLVRGADAQSAHRAVVGAGASAMEFDLNNDRASGGAVLRIGYAPAWPVDVELVAQYWPDLGFYNGRSITMEGTMYPAGRARISPFVVFGIGYFRAADRIGAGFVAHSGVAKTFGVGVTGHVLGSWGLRVDASVRFDPEAFDDELRFGLVSSPLLARPGDLPDGAARFTVLSFTPATGPWRVVEPGIGLAFTTPLSHRHDALVDVLLLHWRTEGSAFFSGWDTRAVVVLPALAWVWRPGRVGVYAGAGPAATLMFEGPDDGLRGGIHADGGVTVPLGAGFSAQAGASLLWLFRSDNPGFVGVSSLGATDERALLLRFGLGR